MRIPRGTKDGMSIEYANYILLLSFITFGVGLAGYLLVPRGSLVSYVLAHAGALGLLGLFGWVAGSIALKKRRGFYVAFFLSSAVPISLGVVAVVIAANSVTCGGSISLAVAVLMTATTASYYGLRI